MNAARFAKLSDAIVAVLEEAQEQALADEAPVWLYELLSVLHYRRCSVISLNYDTLIEVGINSMHLGSRRNGTPWPLPIDDSMGAFVYIPHREPPLTMFFVVNLRYRARGASVGARSNRCAS